MRRKSVLKGMTAADWLIDALFFLLAIAFIYPFWSLLVVSFSTNAETRAVGQLLWPSVWSIEAYKYAFEYANIVRPYANSILRTLTGTLLGVSFTLVAAYPLSKKWLKGRTVLTTYFMIPMFFGGGLIPTYLLYRNIGILDTFFVLVLPGAVSVFNVIVMRNYMMTIDAGVEESAIVDGAGYGRILTSIIIPIAKPSIATVALWTAVSHWSAWFDAMMYVREPEWKVIQVVLRDMLNISQDQMNTMQVAMEDSSMQSVSLSFLNVRSAISMLSIGPIILIYPWVQRYFVSGIMLGSLKG